MEGFNYKQIKELQQLIAPPKNDSESDSDDDDLRQRLSRQKIGPGSIGKPNAGTSESSSKEKSSSPASGAKKSETSDIWHASEVSTISDLPVEDPRKTPEYELKFKQSVGTEDIFLGMNLKTPATASCEWLTLMVKLPAEARDKIELSVESDVVDLRSPKYRLQLPTPFPVDPNGSSAKWHSDSDCLEITLKLSRELDDVNF